MRRPPSLASEIYHHSKALAFSILAVSLVLAAPAFMKKDLLSASGGGSTGMMLAIQSPSAVALAMDPDPASPQQPVQPAPAGTTLKSPEATQPIERQKPVMPEGFKAQWETVTLDQQVQLEMLKKGFSLNQTWKQAGSEYFTYGSYLFDELAGGVRDPQLRRDLKLLSVLAETMGHSVRQAVSLQYDGPPTTDMTHLQVRSGILFHLDGLHTGSLKMVDLNQYGKPVDVGGTPIIQADSTGKTLQAFIKTREQVLNNPMARQYPQAMSLIEYQGHLIEQLARHMETRWESMFYCGNGTHCGGTATYMRVYARQTLPSSQVAAPDVHLSLDQPGRKL